ncbi:MAG: hypothetical protein KIT69_03310 [Propionibacteriaceae bacterium]|nr:hypothetical protein [Propionibacteriaceae bacterium]
MSEASGSRWRDVVAGILIVVTALTVPLAATAAWAQSAVLETDRFVATTADLRDDPAVQEAIVAATTRAIMTGIDVEARTRGGLEGLTELVGLPPRSSELLPSLAGPIALAIEGFITDQVTRVVESDRFSQLWETSVRGLHGQLLAVLRADDSSLLGLEEGRLSLRIGVVVDAVRDRLLAGGFELARFIPDSQATLPLVQVNPATIDAARLGYRGLTTSTVALPVLAGVALAGAILIARNRVRAVRWAGLATAAAGLLMALGVHLGTGALAAALIGPLEALGADRVAALVLGGLRTSAWVIVAGGVLVAAIGLVLGRRPPAPVELG